MDDCGRVQEKYLRSNVLQFMNSMTSLTNKINSEHIFQNCLKIAVVISIYKMNGSEYNVNDYHPISILTIRIG